MSYRGMLVGMTRFERATSWTQTRHANQVAPHPAWHGWKESNLRTRLWRPPLYQLSYIRIEPVASLELATFSLEDCRATSYTSPACGFESLVRREGFDPPSPD